MSLPWQEGHLWRKPFLPLPIVCGLLASLAICSGCKLFGNGAQWRHGETRYAQALEAADVGPYVQSLSRPPCGGGVAAAELAQHARRLEAAHDPGCVDLYFAATCRQWQRLATLGELPARDDLLHESRTYNAVLAKLLVTAQRYGRLDPMSGLQVFHADRPLTIPVELHGFAWSAEDFNDWELVGEYQLAKHARRVRTDGVGVPLVVRRRRNEDEQFFRRVHPFAATAVLRTRAPIETIGVIGDDDDLLIGELVLEFYNPVNHTSLAGAHRRWTLAGDLSAPLAWTASMEPNHPLSAFVQPEATNAQAQLVMLEPYQPGKIPLVFVHGLLSDPTTWITLVNSLRAQVWFRERYQVWAFRYPTGMPFLVSAATLRRELNAALAISPGALDDPAAQQMVLIGHSMGGLVAKLQVTESGTELWNLAANRSLDEIQAEQTDRERLREIFFFAPQPFIRKVIFIGTPHRGSSLASRGIGRVGSWVAKATAEANARHRRIVADNPGVFAPWIARKVPTSVDLLEPDHPLLTTMQKLAVAPRVQLHSIIGVADFKRFGGPGDGVVPLASASHPRVVSEKLVSETHEGLHEAATTLLEIERILER